MELFSRPHVSKNSVWVHHIHRYASTLAISKRSIFSKDDLVCLLSILFDSAPSSYNLFDDKLRNKLVMDFVRQLQIYCKIISLLGGGKKVKEVCLFLIIKRMTFCPGKETPFTLFKTFFDSFKRREIMWGSNFPKKFVLLYSTWRQQKEVELEIQNAN